MLASASSSLLWLLWLLALSVPLLLRFGLMLPLLGALGCSWGALGGLLGAFGAFLRLSCIFSTIFSDFGRSGIDFSRFWEGFGKDFGRLF